MSKIIPAIDDYSILPISVPATRAFPRTVIHHVYLRQHAPKIPKPADSRSLFLVNVPVDSTEAHFRSVFNSLVGPGRFESITFEDERRHSQNPEDLPSTAVTSSKKRKRGDSEKSHVEVNTELPKVWDRTLHRSGGTAVAVLADVKSVEIVMKAVKKVHKTGSYPVWGLDVEDKVPALGSQRYLAHHKLRYPSKAVLQASVDAFMTTFNKKEEEAARVAKRQRNVPDEDGFITVTRGGRTGPARKHDAEQARRRELEKENEKRKGMVDFYRFQGRERKKAEQAELVKKFEEDRKKVEGMRKDRKGRFRPE